MAKLEERLGALLTMPRKQLQQEWERVYSEPAPNLSADLLRLGIAYCLLGKAGRGLSRAAVFQLQEGRAPNDQARYPLRA